MSTGDPYCGVCGGMLPCACYTRIGGVGGVQVQPAAQPVWIGPNTNPPYPYTMPVSNPPPQHFTLDGNAFLNNWTNSIGVTVRRHSPYKSGQLVMVNWALIEGTDALLYEEPVSIPMPTTNVISVGTRKQLHLFKGREALIVLEDANDFAAEVKVAYGEKIGWVNAYLLLPIEEEDVRRLGARRRASTKKTAARTLGHVEPGDEAVDRHSRKLRSRRR